MIGFANAKINIGLFVTGKREDGYHNLESVFYPVPIYDVLEFVPSAEESASLNIHGIDVPGNVQDNLVMKAYNLLSHDYNLPQLSIHLIKNIPTGAGLGGGSSDAAKVLLMLKEYFSLNIESHHLLKYAADLGSDCPFFILNQPSFATGRGEFLEPITLNLKGFYLTIIHPGIHISTKEAFSGIIPSSATFDLRKLNDLPIENWKDTVINVFENGVFTSFPEIANIKLRLYEAGATYSSMSGSGSAVYALFRHKPNQLNWPNHFFIQTILLN